MGDYDSQACKKLDQPNMLSYCYPIFADLTTACTCILKTLFLGWIPVLDKHLPTSSSEFPDSMLVSWRRHLYPSFRRDTAPRLDGRYPLTSSSRAIDEDWTLETTLW